MPALGGRQRSWQRPGLRPDAFTAEAVALTHRLGVVALRRAAGKVRTQLSATRHCFHPRWWMPADRGPERFQIPPGRPCPRR